MTGLRLLPWTTPDGKPCYLSSDDAGSRMNRRADEIEAVQLHMGAELLAHARALLGDRKVHAGELRYLAHRLTEALRDVLRIAESRGDRLAPAADGEGAATHERRGPQGPGVP
ncbi:hypothetical protein [Streptomyces botrytidirepellens]|uniref:Uncharacterized protein n=1 Tax=Streptomyces botrytidirepellens TaxID=2486417 RepID=A0A3M8WIE7_9ACTN|nr:hypothetical protein [Streptomyces botrytidirepellens]RNG27793.1 hypothetical protein EEJ42_12850 [Streptomyces botrytidirepellens]